ncbi:hypothetical protein Esti_003467 [Eimeria stiedai]
MALSAGRKVCLVVPSAAAAAAQASNAAAAATAAAAARAATAAAAELCQQQIPAASLLQRFDVFVFDCDGVLWHGSKLLPGIQQMLQQLQQTPRSSSSSRYKSVYFLSNNSTLSRRSFVAKLNSLGIAATEKQIMCTSYSTARYILEQQQQQESRVYVVGEQGLVDELRANGIDAFGCSEGDCEEIDFSQDPEVCVQPNVGHVVVGLDRRFCYKKLQTAQLYVNQMGAELIGTNTDPLGNFSTRQKWAGAGTMVAAVAAACQRPPTLMGKPSPQMKRLMLDLLAGEELGSVLLVGDSLVTDIAFAASAGLSSCLCLTGVTDAPMLRNAFAISGTTAAAAAAKKGTATAAAEAAERNLSTLPDFIIDTAAHLAS